MLKNADFWTLLNYNPRHRIQRNYGSIYSNGSHREKNCEKQQQQQLLKKLPPTLSNGVQHHRTKQNKTNKHHTQNEEINLKWKIENNNGIVVRITATGTI